MSGDLCDVSHMATQDIQFLPILNPFCRLANGLNEGRDRSASCCLQCGVTRARQDGRTGPVSWECGRTPHQPFSGEGPAHRGWQDVVPNALGAAGCPTLQIRWQLTIDPRSADAASTG